MAYVQRVKAFSYGACLALLVGCGSDEGSRADTPEAEQDLGATPSDEADDSDVEGDAPSSDFVVTLDDGRRFESGQARLTVREGAEFATLELIAGNEEGDSLYVTLGYSTASPVYGTHSSELTLPNGGRNVAHFLYGGSPPYHYSRAGNVELTIAADSQDIEGRFELELSEATDIGDGVFEPVGDVMPVTGTFRGHVEVFCYSLLVGHSYTLLPTGEGLYCAGLEL